MQGPVKSYQRLSAAKAYSSEVKMFDKVEIILRSGKCYAIGHGIGFRELFCGAIEAVRVTYTIDKKAGPGPLTTQTTTS